MNKPVTGETTPEFIKSSYSVPEGECVDASIQKNYAIVRDSKDPNGLSLIFNRKEWLDFINRVKNGELDLDR